MREQLLPAMAIVRHRMSTDGEGVTTLVVSYGCPLQCKFCLNPMTWDEKEYAGCELLTPQELYEKVKLDSLYFIATGGGITFGGGEPLLHADFIREFRSCCDANWKLAVETSLHVSTDNIKKALEVVDEFIVDVKTSNRDVYKAYTGQDALVWENLKLLQNTDKKITVKVPYIEGYTTRDDVAWALTTLQKMGFADIKEVVYYNNEQIKELRKNHKNSKI